MTVGYSVFKLIPYLSRLHFFSLRLFRMKNQYLRTIVLSCFRLEALQSLYYVFSRKLLLLLFMMNDDIPTVFEFDVIVGKYFLPR